MAGSADRAVGRGRRWPVHDRRRARRGQSTRSIRSRPASASCFPRIVAVWLYAFGPARRARPAATTSRWRPRSSSRASAPRRRAAHLLGRCRGVVVVALATAWSIRSGARADVPARLGRRSGVPATARIPRPARAATTARARPPRRYLSTLRHDRHRERAHPRRSAGRAAARRRPRLRVVSRMGARREGGQGRSRPTTRAAAAESNSAPPHSARASATSWSTTTRRRPTSFSWKFVEGDMLRRLDGTTASRPTAPTATWVHYELAVELAVPLPGLLKRRAAARSWGAR